MRDGRGVKAPLHPFSRPYVPGRKGTEWEVKKALEQDKKRFGAEECKRRKRQKIREDLERAEKLRKEEIERGERKIKRMEEREKMGKDPSKMSTDEEDDGIDNTVLTVFPSSPDPRNSQFGYPLSTDVRLKDAQRQFEASGEKRTAMWRPGSSPVKSGGEEREGERDEQNQEEGEGDERIDERAEEEEEERENERFREDMKVVYEGVEEEALTVRDMLEKTGADPDSRRELVILAAQLIKVNEQLIGEKEEESKKHVKEHREAMLRSKSEANIS